MNKKEEFLSKYPQLSPESKTLILWSAYPFLELLDEIDELYKYLDILSISFPLLQNEDVVNILKDNMYTKNEAQEMIDRVHGYLKEEKRNGYFHTNSQFSILLFAYLEGGIKRFIMSLFEHLPTVYDIKEVKDIKISVAEYRKCSKEELYGYLFERYEDSVAKGEKYGVSRFEKMLKPFGFGGAVDEEVKKSIFELAQIRNCLLHKGGRADKAIIENCSWLELKLNERVSINNEQVISYCNNVTAYIQTVARRVIAHVTSQRANG